MTVLFRVAAGPVLGFGHLRRAVSLARALGVSPIVSVRGGKEARAAAARLGCRLMDGAAHEVLARTKASVLVIDDPHAASAYVWLRVARRFGVPVASVHDLGIAWVPSDLLVDGSFSSRPLARPGRSLRNQAQLLGPRYMALDPRFLVQAPRSSNGARPRVLIALGGGPRRRHALALARAIRARCADVSIRIAGGFTHVPASSADIVWLPPLPTLADELASATAAIVAGGVTLYEACRLGVPTVAVAVSTLSAQRHTVRAAAALGVTMDGGALGARGTVQRVADRIEALLNRPKLRRTLAASGRRVVDGRGAIRVARAIAALARNEQ